MSESAQIVSTANEERVNLLARWDAFLAAPLPEELFLYFRRFLVFKLSLWWFARIPLPGLFERAPLLFFGVVLLIPIGIVAFRRKGYEWGVLALALDLAYFEIYHGFPDTLNHQFLQVFLLLVVFFYSRTQETRSTGLRLVQAVILIAWLFSGMQKLAQGMWWNGDYFLYEMLTNDGTIAATLRLGTRLVWAGAAEAPFPLAAAPVQSFAQVPAAATFAMVAWANLAMLAEIALPVFVLFACTRRCALYGLVAMQALIPVGAGIAGFALTGLACLFLFYPAHARRNYAALAAAALACIVTGMLDTYGAIDIPVPWM